jgi:LPS sulfotransferase NodH
MKNPIIYTTPRTGSTLICKLLGNISRQLYGHKNVLYEYFNARLIDRRARNMMVEYRMVPVFDDDIIVPFKDLFKGGQEKDVQGHRLHLLRKNPKHTIKIFPGMNQEVMDFIISEYDFIFLERQNKLEQYLSFCSIVHGQKTHFSINDKSTVQKFPVSNEVFERFIDVVTKYKQFQQTHPGTTIYYEDFMNLGGNQQALATLLGLQDAVLTDCKISTKPSPYETTYEDLITNKAEWLEQKPIVIEALSKLN